MTVEKTFEKRIGDGIKASLATANLAAVGIFGAWGAYPPNEAVEDWQIGITVGGRRYENSSANFFELPVVLSLAVPVAVDVDGAKFEALYESVIGYCDTLQKSLDACQALAEGTGSLVAYASYQAGSPTVGDERKIDLQINFNLSV